LKTVLSVDVAKNKSMIMLMNSDGEILIDSKEIKHNLEEFEKVKEEIKEINPENLTVFMESTGIYHLPVERYFKENGFNTLVINSLTTKNNYDTIRKTKTDKKDCYRLAKLFFVNEVEYHHLSKKDLYANLKAMTRQYFYLTQVNVSCKNRYKRLINICFPELEEIFKSSRIYEETALNFIKAFPHAYIVKEKRIDALYNNLYKTNSRHDYYYKRLAHQIKDIASNSYPGIDKEHSDVKNLSDMAGILQENIKTINELKEKMIETAKQSPYFEIINSFYGIGEVLTAELLGELGDITRFDTHKQLIAFCGLDPTIIQSGKSINVHGAISKRGNKYARWILFNISQMVVKLGHQCPEHPVYNYYLMKKAEGKHYYENLTACSTKILRMLYSMCKNNKQFLEK
jgi:transposase